MTRCFLFGAGASKYCTEMNRYDETIRFGRAMPLMTDFWKLVKSKYPEEYKTIEKEFTDYNILKSEEVLDDLNLESIYDLIENSNLRPSWKNSFNTRINKWVLEFIYKPNQNIFQLTSSTDNQKTLYDIIILDADLNTDFFISLNYDLLLDRAIWNKHPGTNEIRAFARINYGDPIFKNATGVINIDYDTNNLNKFLMADNTIVPLYKLHGSFNWKITNSEIIIDGRFLTKDDLDYCLFHPPKTDKGDFLNLPVISNIKEKAMNRLKTTDELIIVGLSLSDNDKLFDEIFSAFYSINPTFKKIKVITKKEQSDIEEFKNKYITRIKKNTTINIEDNKNIFFYTEGFSDKSISFIFD